MNDSPPSVKEPWPKYEIGDQCLISEYQELLFVITDIHKLDNGRFIYWCDAVGKDTSVAWKSEEQLFVPFPGKTPGAK